MDKAMAKPRTELSQWAPRITTVQINPEKIGEIIGPKGKTIRAHPGRVGRQDRNRRQRSREDCSRKHGGQQPCPRDGRGDRQGARGRSHLRGAGEEHHRFWCVHRDPAWHRRLVPHLRVGRWPGWEKTEDVLKKGDVTKVKLLSIDEKGRLRLSRKAAPGRTRPAGEHRCR